MSDISASDTIVSSTEKTLVDKAESSTEKSASDLKNSSKSNKSLPSKTTSRFQQQTAASRGRTKTTTNPPLKRPAVPKPTARQLPPRPPAAQKSTSVPKPQTPNKKNAPKKACSTPTSEDVTISDMTLDASCISIVNRTRAAPPTNILDDTVTNAAPVLKMRAPAGKRAGLDCTVMEMGSNTSGGNSTVRRHTMVPPRGNTSGGRGVPRTGVKVKQPLMAKVTQTVTKGPASDLEEGASNEEEDEITEEMMSVAYTRYLQAKFIEMKSRQAREKAEKDCENQLFHAFSATEKLRQEMMRKQEENLMWSNIALMRKSLELVETKLAPVLMVLGSVNEKLSLVAGGLDRVKHNLIVQGINLADQETAASELESLSKMFIKFNEDVAVHKNVVEAEGVEVARMAEEYSSLADKYSKTIELIKDCRSMLEQADQLASQEASLAISLSQLEMERKKRMLVDL